MSNYFKKSAMLAKTARAYVSDSLARRNGLTEISLIALPRVLRQAMGYIDQEIDRQVEYRIEVTGLGDPISHSVTGFQPFWEDYQGTIARTCNNEGVGITVYRDGKPFPEDKILKEASIRHFHKKQ